MGRKKGKPPSWDVGLHYRHNGSSLTLKHDSIIISGKIEDAAWALADECLRVGKDNDNINWRYFSILEVTLREGVYDLTLLKESAIDAPTWKIFKKDVEKICNKLVVFM